MSTATTPETIHLFIPCFIDQLFPQTAVNLVTLLRQLNFKVAYNPNQTCCGQPALNAGFWDEAHDVALKFAADFEGCTTIVCPSASCVGFVRQHYVRVLGDRQSQTATALSNSLVELSEFLVAQPHYTQLKPRLAGRALYHDSCAALRECGIKEAPRQLLALVEDLELVPNSQEDICCGFGGTFAVKYESISVAMAEKKVEAALAANAQYIISTDWSCLMHLQGYIKAQQLDLEVLHLADVLVSR